MTITLINLYRQGNASSPRMDNVRVNKDVAVFEDQGKIWVNADLGGGVSTFAKPRKGKNWWMLEQGTNIPNELSLINNHNEHWLWQPSYTMVLEEYQSALRQVDLLFVKVS